MIVCFNLDDYQHFSSLTPPYALTIGFFDGVHCGHVYLLQQLREKATEQGSSVVLTFANHPKSILAPAEKPQLLTSLEERLALLEKEKVDLCLILPFTKEIAGQNFADFLITIRQKIPFHHLVLGEDAVLGYQKQGDKKKLTAFCPAAQF